MSSPANTLRESSIQRKCKKEGFFLPSAAIAAILNYRWEVKNPETGLPVESRPLTSVKVRIFVISKGQPQFLEKSARSHRIVHISKNGVRRVKTRDVAWVYGEGEHGKTVSIEDELAGSIQTTEEVSLFDKTKIQVVLTRTSTEGDTGEFFRLHIYHPEDIYL